VKSVRFKIDFAGKRNLFFTISLTITVLGIASLLLFGLNLGVDFESGTTLDMTTGRSVTMEEIEALFDEAGVDPVVTLGGNNQDRVNARFDRVLEEAERDGIIAAFKAKYGEENFSYEENTVDAEMAREFARNTIFYVGLACLLIAVYVIIRFEWRFSLAGLVSLVHVAFVIVAVFSIFRLEVNLTFIAAVLTMIGYSINDTIVIFDRIRDNLKTAKLKTFDDLKRLTNESLWQTLTRSINTGLTVLIVAVLLMVMGSESIRLFSLAMVIGLIVGVYSSICIAAPLWMVLKDRSMKAAKRRPPAKAAG
jgi:SecD/SecF fusion protein